MFNKTVSILLCLFIFGCDSPKSDTPSVQSAFIPAQCSFSQTLNGDPRFTGAGITEPVAEYSCPLYDKMTCTAYAVGEEYLGLDCEVTDPLQPQGVPSGCTIMPLLAGGTPSHGFLDGTVVSMNGYDCGTLNGNLQCGYYRDNGPPLREEIRCHLF